MGIAAPVGVQERRAIVQVAVHDHHALPRLVVALGGVDLVAGTEPGAPLPVVDDLDALGVEPGEHEPLVGKRLLATHGRDGVALAVSRQVGDDDPLDHRLVRVIAVQKPQALHVFALVGVRSGQEQLPTPELGVNALDCLGVCLEGLDHTVTTLAEADAEAAVGVTALGPLGSGLGEAGEHLIRDTPVAELVLPAQGSELLVDRLLEGVLVCELTLLVDELDHQRRVVALTNPVRIRAGHPSIGEVPNRRVQSRVGDVDKAFHDGEPPMQSRWRSRSEKLGLS